MVVERDEDARWVEAERWVCQAGHGRVGAVRTRSSVARIG